MKGYDYWLGNHGNPGIWPSEDDLINWREAKEYADQEAGNYGDEYGDEEYDRT
jgi:hypothetical protein